MSIDQVQPGPEISTSLATTNPARSSRPITYAMHRAAPRSRAATKTSGGRRWRSTGCRAPPGPAPRSRSACRGSRPLEPRDDRLRDASLRRQATLRPSTAVTRLQHDGRDHQEDQPGRCVGVVHRATMTDPSRIPPVSPGASGLPTRSRPLHARPPTHDPATQRTVACAQPRCESAPTRDERNGEIYPPGTTVNDVGSTSKVFAMSCRAPSSTPASSRTNRWPQGQLAA